MWWIRNESWSVYTADSDNCNLYNFLFNWLCNWLLISLLFLIITLIIDYVFYWFPKLLQGLLNFSSVPVLHYLQAVLFIKIWTIFMNILYNSQHSLKSGGKSTWYIERPAIYGASQRSLSDKILMSPKQKLWVQDSSRQVASSSISDGTEFHDKTLECIINVMCFIYRLPPGFTQLRNLTRLGLNDVSLDRLPQDIGR